MYRQRLQKSEYEKKILTLDPALGGLRDGFLRLARHVPGSHHIPVGFQGQDFRQLGAGVLDSLHPDPAIGRLYWRPAYTS